MADERRFKKVKIIDHETVRAELDDELTHIHIEDGGLPEKTSHVTMRTDKRNPDGKIILGAYIEGRVEPVTVLGTVKK